MAENKNAAETAVKAAEEIVTPKAGGAVDIFVSALKEMGESIVEAMPNVLVGILLFVLGYLLFKYVSKFLVALLQRIGADEVVEKLGVGGLLRGLGIKTGFSAVCGSVIFWLLMLRFIMIVGDLLELSFLTDPLNGIISILPQVITAVIIFVVGYIVAEMVKNAVLSGGERMGLDYAKALSKVIYGFLYIVIIILALRQLGIETALLESAVQILLGAFAVALALALGLGLNSLAKNIVSGVYAREIYRPGSTIFYDDVEAKVAAVGAITTKLEKPDGSFVMIPNNLMTSEVMRGRDS
jgi:small-conductance mechanosensitive channel